MHVLAGLEAYQKYNNTFTDLIHDVHLSLYCKGQCHVLRLQISPVMIKLLELFLITATAI